jgi:hypothetical protein
MPASEQAKGKFRNAVRLARRGWEYYVYKRVWNRDLEVNSEGIKTIIRLYNEMNQTKTPLANPAKSVVPSFLKEALRGERP